MNKRAKRIFLFFFKFQSTFFDPSGEESFRASKHFTGRERRCRSSSTFGRYIGCLYVPSTHEFSLSAKCSSDTASQRKFLRRSRFFRGAEGEGWVERNSFEPSPLLAVREGGGVGGEKTPLIRPISKNIPTVHDKTRFRSLTLFSLPSWYFSKNSSPLSIVSTAERKIFAKILASQNFINLYTSIDLGNLKDLGI